MLKDGESFLPPTAKASITIAWIKWVYPIDSLWQYTMPHTQRNKMCLPFFHRDTRTAYWFLPWMESERAIHGLQSRSFSAPNSKRKQQRRMLIQNADKLIFNYIKDRRYWLVGRCWSMLTDCDCDLVGTDLTTVQGKAADWDQNKMLCHFIESIKFWYELNSKTIGDYQSQMDDILVFM